MSPEHFVLGGPGGPPDQDQRLDIVCGETLPSNRTQHPASMRSFFTIWHTFTELPGPRKHSRTCDAGRGVALNPDIAVQIVSASPGPEDLVLCLKAEDAEGLGGNGTGSRQLDKFQVCKQYDWGGRAALLSTCVCMS